MILKNQKGVAAVEFAIVLPVLVILAFGIIDFSLLIYNKQILTNASREGARSAIVEDSAIDSKQIVVDYCDNKLINLDSGVSDVVKDDVAISDTNNYFTVTVTYNYKYFFGSLFGLSDTIIAGKTVMLSEVIP